MNDGLPEKNASAAPSGQQMPLRARPLALGIGCERGCPADEIITLALTVLAEAGLVPDAVAAIASIELKRDEPGILALGSALGRKEPRRHPERLLAKTGRLSERSATVFRATGCWGVAEAAALAACGSEGVLLVPKRRSPRATCAVARAR